jgi:hypothetical protein
MVAEVMADLVTAEHPQALVARFGLSGLAILELLAHSHQQTQVTCNETVYSN